MYPGSEGVYLVVSREPVCPASGNMEHLIYLIYRAIPFLVGTSRRLRHACVLVQQQCIMPGSWHTRMITQLVLIVL